MGDKSIDCISNDSGDSWDILSNSGSEPERDFLNQPPSSCPIVCANCGDLLSDEFLQCLLCKNCYICAKCKANSPLAVHCKELEAHSFIPTHESISPKDISNSENCESDILSLPETDNTPSVYEDFTDIDNWMKSSSNAQSFTLSDFDSNKDYVEVEPISSNPTTNNEYQEKKCTNQLSQNDGSILQVLLQFLQNTNQPIISTPESNLFNSKLLPVSTFESSLSKTSFHPHYATTVHNVLLNMDDSSAFQSWFNLSSSLGKKKKNTRHKEESFSSNSSTSSSSSLPYEPAVETLSPRHHDSFPLITTSSIVGITSGRFTISSSSSSSSSSPLTLTTSATRTRTTTTTPMTLKMQSSSSSSSVELTGDNSPNRSSSTSDFSSQSSSVCSLSSSSLGAATQFLKSVVKRSTNGQLVETIYNSQ
ncbi:unnamed protein product [Schistosoma turkestanicum]|nr:unnamed protein product [Schistosoma turkestanicum]